MNPSVEEGVGSGAGAGVHAPESNTDEQNRQLSWSKICSQHEAVLNSHLGMLQSAKELALSDGDLSAAMASMLERTNQLMTDFHMLKEQMANNMSGTSSMPQNGSTEDGEAKSTGSYSFAPKKRPRLSLPQADDTTDGSASENSYSQKRKRLDLVPRSNEDDAQAETPESAQTEDISEEVQRRLEIKEQQRRRRNSRPEKRKRDSDSDDSAPSYYYNPPPEDPGRPKKRRRDLKTTTSAAEE